jgi:hypothetical protein
MANTLLNDLRQLAKDKADYDRKKAAASKAELAFKERQQKVYDRMEAEEAGSMTDRRLGVQFCPAETVYAQLQDRSEFVTWAKENDDELLVEKENGELLNALVRACLDNGEPLPPGVGVRVRQYISQRAA